MSQLNHCVGCGLALQSEDPAYEGYTPKEEATLCQRCFRLRHYGETSSIIGRTVAMEPLLSKLHSMDALFLWVIDLFHLEESMIDGLHRHLPDKDIIVIATKRELLPVTLSDTKILTMLQQRVRDANVVPKGYVVVSDYGKDGADQVFKAINIFRNNRDVVVFGVANAGKSTLLNALFPSRDPLTVSQFPGTTLDLVPIYERGFTIYDTPGIEMRSTFLHAISKEQVKLLQPKHPIRPVVYQLSEDQTLVIGQTAMIHLIGAKKATAVCYFPEGVEVHRTKGANAQTYWNAHTQNKVPYVNVEEKLIHRTHKLTHDKMDILLPYVGFVTISGEIDSLESDAIESCDLYTRKAVI